MVPGRDHVGRVPVGSRKKKLRAGVLYSLEASHKDGQRFECRGCDSTRRKYLNCHNHERIRYLLLEGEKEWLQVTSKLRHVLKLEDMKFFACPLSVVTQKTWQILALVNETTNAEGDLLHLPFPGTLLDQPDWFRSAVKIVKAERANWRNVMMEKSRTK